MLETGIGVGDGLPLKPIQTLLARHGVARDGGIALADDRGGREDRAEPLELSRGEPMYLPELLEQRSVLLCGARRWWSVLLRDCPPAAHRAQSQPRAGAQRTQCPGALHGACSRR